MVWNLFREEINSKFQMVREFKNCEETEGQIQIITKIIQDVTEKCISNMEGNKEGPVELSKQLQIIIKERNKARRTFQRNKTMNIVLQQQNFNLTNEIFINFIKQENRKGTVFHLRKTLKNTTQQWKKSRNSYTLQ